MKLLSTFAALAIFVSALAVAQNAPRYAGWAEGPVRHLMTKDDVKRWKAIRSDQEAEAFIDLFWARRDPTPDTERNEFRVEFDARVELADREFSKGRIRGALTDQGRVLILLGPPWQVASKGSTASISTMGAGREVPTDSSGSVLLPTTRGELRRQVWTYAHGRKPQFVPDNEFVMVFVEEAVDEWQLAVTERGNPEGILMRAQRAMIVSPKLMKAPVYEKVVSHPATAFRSQELKKAWDLFRAEKKPAPVPTHLTWGQFLTPEGESMVAVQLYAVGGSGIETGQKVTFFGVIENSAGETVRVSEEDRSMSASGGDSYVDTALRLEPGDYAATFGLAGVDGTIVSAVATPMKVDRIDPAATAISPLILSTNIYPVQAIGPNDAFTFGGLKVVPKGDSLFTTKGDLWYFIEMRNPGVSTEGKPAVKVEVDIAGKTKGGRVALKLPQAEGEITKLQGTKDRYAIGVAIPLESFVPGDYTMKIHLVDTILSKEYALEKQFRITGM